MEALAIGAHCRATGAGCASRPEYVPWGKVEAPVAVEWLVNGAGAFEEGGPGGDNGLSGKKLVAQAYGSAVPIAGGATHGKDPHKVDPRGQALARELAREAVVKGSAREATVWLAYRPGDVTPRWTEVTTVPDDGYTEDAKIQYWQSLYSGYRARMIAAAKRKKESGESP